MSDLTGDLKPCTWNFSLFQLYFQNMVPVLKYVRGEHLSQDHWLDMFRLLGLPRGTTLERLTFNDILGVANTIIEKALELKVYTHTHTLAIFFCSE